MHNKRLANTGSPHLTLKPDRPEVCIIDGCRNGHYGHGLCYGHYNRWWRYGDPLAGSSVRQYDE